MQRYESATNAGYLKVDFTISNAGKLAVVAVSKVPKVVNSESQPQPFAVTAQGA